MVTGKVFPPGVLELATVAWNENTLSPATASPWLASSKNCWMADPPIELRSPATAIPVLGGLLPGVTLTVRSVEPPAMSVFGLAAPVPDGLVAGTVTVKEIVALPVRD